MENQQITNSANDTLALLRSPKNFRSNLRRFLSEKSVSLAENQKPTPIGQFLDIGFVMNPQEAWASSAAEVYWHLVIEAKERGLRVNLELFGSEEEGTGIDLLHKFFYAEVRSNTNNKMFVVADSGVVVYENTVVKSMKDLHFNCKQPLSIALYNTIDLIKQGFFDEQGHFSPFTVNAFIEEKVKNKDCVFFATAGSKKNIHMGIGYVDPKESLEEYHGLFVTPE